MRAASDGGAAKELIEPFQRQIQSARRQKEIETALAKVEVSAAQPGGWNRASELQQQYVEEWNRNPALRRRLEQAMSAAKEGMRERGQKLERAVALMLRREGTEFASKIKADLGKLTVARRDKKGAWFLVATGVLDENGEVKMEFWTQPKYAQDQDRWNQVWREQEREREKWAVLAAEIEAEEEELRAAQEETQAALERERARIAEQKEQDTARRRAQKRARREKRFEEKRQSHDARVVEVEDEELRTESAVEQEAENDAHASDLSNVWWRIYITKSDAAELILNRLEQQAPNLILERLGAELVESRPNAYSVQAFDNLDNTRALLQAEGLEVIEVEEYAG